MNVGELLDLLEDVDRTVELRMAHQPSWPLALTVAAVRCPGDEAYDEVECEEHPGYVVGHSITEAMAVDGYEVGDECEWEPDEEDPRDRREHVWIVCIDHPYNESPYAPRWVFEG